MYALPNDPHDQAETHLHIATHVCVCVCVKHIRSVLKFQVFSNTQCRVIN